MRLTARHRLSALTVVLSLLAHGVLYLAAPSHQTTLTERTHTRKPLQLLSMRTEPMRPLLQLENPSPQAIRPHLPHARRTPPPMRQTASPRTRPVETTSAPGILANSLEQLRERYPEPTSDEPDARAKNARVVSADDYRYLSHLKKRRKGLGRAMRGADGKLLQELVLDDGSSVCVKEPSRFGDNSHQQGVATYGAC